MKERNDNSAAKSKILITIEDGYPMEETVLIKQRLRNLFEIAIAIGQRKGLLHSHIPKSRLSRRPKQADSL